MNKAWQQFIADQGAVTDAAGVTECFSEQPYPPLGAEVLVDAQCLRVLDLTGPDCIKFLQGQITQDAQQLAQARGLFADHCNPKGRIVASFYALGLGAEHIRIILPASNADHFAAHLKKYLVFAKAELQQRDDLVCIALMNLSAQALRSLAGELQAQAALGLPAEQGGVCQQDEQSAFAVTDSTLLLTLSEPNAQGLWQTLAPKMALGGQRYWAASAIAAGVAWVAAHNREHYTPHQINHQLINAISFRKGCYTGQEVVARMHYKATLKSHAYGFSLTNDQPIEPQAVIYAGDEKAGTVINAAETGANQWLLLAEVRDALVNSTLHVEGVSAEKLHQVPLPYAINK
ncbi:hypothetical protein L1F30_08870 [Simiduia sp. 21SJ11W-1]|uniref:CAF17-like 4Fe-4S cluster assembly/insertion protein YgfZ n=1 Tax=Simiduia sp. 21SJ11W-1 TaxID=2909669 RepID=UPI00209F1739|nr:hypothetical protein [Simiduia sp. 21SJ11W-1]UTA46295.1 hypothetical protein L1F30_08870 [Simiduia sp. 21SJ11W-1]